VKHHCPAALRNRAPILEVLREELTASGTVLEVASGSGEHVVFFAAAMPDWIWQPTDVDASALHSIAAYVDEAGLGNVLVPRSLDVRRERWGIGPFDAIVCINMIHIAPWQACVGLFRGGFAALAAGAPLVLYGPYAFEGRFSAPSNEAFDASLRARNPEWGVRDVVDVTRIAETFGLHRERIVPMPSNNHVLVFRKPEAGCLP
jgi:hypothetical protein